MDIRNKYCHGDRRDSFNNRYEDLLRVKGVYDSHATEAAMAYANERKYRGWERKHAQYGSQS
ncbi:hypothetical protein F4825DRAFT_430348 [Nemania diffusa]|nr:hypothetical protein F4825DRAFT_430348 [Nemania diffusa]